jgi:hypothetical protein
MKKLRSILRRLFFSNANPYLKFLRARQGCERAGEREDRWYGDPFGGG